MSITLYLLNKKGFHVLSSLVEKDKHKMFVDRVVGAEDGGNSEDYYKEIRQLCNENSIPFFHRNGKFTNNSNYSMAIGWRWLIHDVPNLIVLHDSFLPRYRGFAPLTNMLINGEDHLGVSAIWASDGMDEGDIITQKKIPIDYPLKIESAIEIVSQIYGEIAANVVENLVSGEKMVSVSQNMEDATYSIWRDEDDYFINWNDTADNIKRFVDAVGHPYDGAKTKTAAGEVLRIVECSVVENVKSEIRAPGKILMFQNELPVILCGQGNKAIRLEEFGSLDGTSFTFSKFRTRLL